MIFEVTPDHIEALTDTDLRILIGYLAEREVVSAGTSASAVTYGGHQNAKDGGIDVRVAIDGSINGYVPRSATGFQVKAESFSKSAIIKEMRPNGKLRESIKVLGEAGGAYVIVSSKGSVSDTSLANRRKAMVEAIADEASAASLHVDFYDNRRISTWVNQHPSLIAWVRASVGQPISGWRPFQDWSSSPGGADEEYNLDESIRLIGARIKDDGLKAVDGINELRSILGKGNGAVRLVGLSGVGKTRLAQALFDEHVGERALSPRLAVYADVGDDLDPVPAELLSRIQSSGQSCILIVDNCGAELHRKLVSRLSPNSAVSLLTIEYDISDDEPENTDVFKLEPASKEVIEKILERRYPKLTSPEIRTIAEFSEGNFRIALALANTSRDGQSLANLRDRELFTRLFQQKNQDNPALLRAAKVCSLVYSFDAESLEGDDAELPILAALAEQSVSEFSGHVAELKRRQLIQKRAKWRALLPHALAHRLAKQALEDIPATELSAKFIDIAPERLLKSFSRRLGCLHDSEEAQKIVGEWLGSDGWIADIDGLNELGLVILENVAPVNPAAVLRAIETAASARANFFEVNSHGHSLIRLLRALAYDSELFDRSVQLIARFSQTLVESNNMGDATNVFKSLFFMALSGTHASPRQRGDFARRLSGGASKEEHQLTMSALDAMLECGHFSSSYGFDFGTRKRDYGYHPRTWSERVEWFSEAFSLARDLAKKPSYRGDVRTMIAAQFRSLARYSGAIDELIALAEGFAEDGGWPEGWTGVRSAVREARKEKADDFADQLKALDEKLAPTSLADRIASYVLPSQWGALDIADIDFDDERKYQKNQKMVASVCEGIGAELANDLAALRQHLPAMLDTNSNRSFIVAQAIGRETSDFVSVWGIIGEEVLKPARAETSYAFPGAFLGGLAGKNRPQAERLVEQALLIPEWHSYFVRLQSAIGLNSEGVRRLIEATKLPTISTWSFRNLAFGQTLDGLTGDELRNLLVAIAEREDGDDPAAEILYMRLYSLNSEEKPIGEPECEVGRALMARLSFDKKKNQELHRVAEIVKNCLSAPGDTPVAEQMCRNLLEAIDNYSVSAWDYGEVVSELAANFPRTVLDELVERAGTTVEGRSALFRNFREHRPCPLRTIDDATLITWACEKPETRFTILAESIGGWYGAKARQNPQAALEDDDDKSLQWTPAALRLIREAPDPVPVLQAFRDRFRPSGWSGSLASILAGREPLLLALTTEHDERISTWASTEIPKLAAEVQQLRDWEARDDRRRDERFEW